MDLNLAKFNLIKENSRPNSATLHTSPAKEHYKELLAESMFESADSISDPTPDDSDTVTKVSSSPRILSFSKKAPAPSNGHNNRLRVLYTQNKTDSKSSKSTSSARHIPSQPEKILDAPELMDDYYLNLLDWNSQNVLAVALGRTVYLWNSSTGSIEHVRFVSISPQCLGHWSSFHLVVKLSHAKFYRSAPHSFE